MSKRDFVPATLCYVRQNHQTLMLHRNRKPNDIHEGKWNGLGGKVEPGESPLDCVIREVREESGLTILDPTFKGFIAFPLFDGRRDWHVHLFTASRFTGSLIESPEGELRWIDTDRLLELPLWPGDRIFIPLLAQPGVFMGRFDYTHGQLAHHELTNFPV